MLSRFERAEDDNYRYLIVSGPKYCISKWVKRTKKGKSELMWASEVKMGDLRKEDYKMEWDRKDWIEKIPKRNPFFTSHSTHNYDIIWTPGVVYLIQYDADLEYPASFS